MTYTFGLDTFGDRNSDADGIVREQRVMQRGRHRREVSRQHQSRGKEPIAFGRGVECNRRVVHGGDRRGGVAGADPVIGRIAG